MAEKRPALGRGLGALIPPKPAAAAASAPAPGPQTTAPRPQDIDIDLLAPNPRQPRGHIEEHALEELAQSIRANGVIQPIVVRQVDGRFEIVAGERRWRAAQRAGLLRVPIVVRAVEDQDLLQVALIENIQREDLNAIEEAQAYRRLSDEHGLSQDAISQAVGKDRATVANYIRLLRLPAEVRNEVAAGALSMGHARAILALGDEAAERRVAREVVSRGLSVRETEALVRRETTPPPARAVPEVDPNTRAAEHQLKIALGTRVRIVRKGRGGADRSRFRQRRGTAASLRPPRGRSLRPRRPRRHRGLRAPPRDRARLPLAGPKWYKRAFGRPARTSPSRRRAGPAEALFSMLPDSISAPADASRPGGRS